MSVLDGIPTKWQLWIVDYAEKLRRELPDDVPPGLLFGAHMGAALALLEKLAGERVGRDEWLSMCDRTYEEIRKAEAEEGAPS